MGLRKKTMETDTSLTRRIANVRRVLDGSTNSWSTEYWTAVLTHLDRMRIVAEVLLCEGS